MRSIQPQRRSKHMKVFTILSLTALLVILSASETEAFALLSFRKPTTTHDGQPLAASRAPARRHQPLYMARKSASSIDPVKKVTGKILSTLIGAASCITREFRGLTRQQRLLFAGTFILGWTAGRIRPFWKRITNVQELTPSMFGPNAPVLTGRAVSVSDGDTIRFLHVPTPFHPTSIRKGKEKMSEVALAVRVCTIDTPETAKFGKPGQPFGKEAKENLLNMLENKNVKVRLLQADQYGRGVGEVFVKGALNQKLHVDEEMLKAGFAEVYLGGGAVYGPLGKDGYLALEKEAQKKKQGIWSQKKRETAAEYKRRTK